MGSGGLTSADSVRVDRGFSGHCSAWEIRSALVDVAPHVELSFRGMGAGRSGGIDWVWTEVEFVGRGWRQHCLCAGGGIGWVCGFYIASGAGGGVDGYKPLG